MDTQLAHKYFSADCFNGVWELLEKESRSPQEELLMQEMAHASLFHWLKRNDCDATKVSVGLWLVARVHATLGHGTEAKRYAGECIEVSQSNSLPPFYLGYALEAAARAALILGDQADFTRHIEAAGEQLSKLSEQEERDLLAPDLASLKAMKNPGDTGSS